MANSLIGRDTDHIVDSVAQLKTLDIDPSNYVRTRSYSADYLTTGAKASGGALYFITTIAAQRAKLGDPTYTPDGTVDFTLNNSNVAVHVETIGALVFDSVDSMKTHTNQDPQSGDILETNSYYTYSPTVEAKGGAKYQVFTLAEWQALTGETTPDGYIDHVLANGNVAKLPNDLNLNASQAGLSTSNTADENYDVWQAIGRQFGLSRRKITIDPGTYAFDVFNPNNIDIIGDSVTFNFTYDATKSVVMGQISNCTVRGITFNSLETDLENQRVTVAESYIEHCNFTNWLNPSNNNSWGVYISGQDNVTIFKCGFQNNTQSDITVVDGGDNIRLIQCYALDDATDPLHINLEPNNSASFNNVLIQSSKLGKLYLLENATGGTSNKAVTVENCLIEELTYDGASTVFINCVIEDYSTETEVYFGDVRLINSMELTPNLIDDPYMCNIAFNSTSATTDNNSWYMNARSGSIGTDQLDPLEENGVRYTRINPTNASGTVNFRPTTPIPATAGDNYLIAITGRLDSGTSGRFLQVYDGATDKNCRLFRQSNIGSGNEYFTTQLAIIPAGATNDFLIKVGLYATSTESVDIAAVSVHKILNGEGGNAETVLNSIHNLKIGGRYISNDDIPTMSDANLNGFQPEDRVYVNNQSRTYYWNGTAFVLAY